MSWGCGCLLGCGMDDGKGGGKPPHAKCPQQPRAGRIAVRTAGWICRSRNEKAASRLPHIGKSPHSYPKSTYQMDTQRLKNFWVVGNLRRKHAPYPAKRFLLLRRMGFLKGLLPEAGGGIATAVLASGQPQGATGVPPSEYAFFRNLRRPAARCRYRRCFVFALLYS